MCRVTTLFEPSSYSFIQHAKQDGKSIKTYSSYKDFLLDLSLFDYASNFFVDVSLGDGVRGEEVAKKLFELGFTNISLTTGYDAEDIEVPRFIKQVLGKSFPK